MPYGTLAADTMQSSTAGTPPQFNDGNGTQVGTLCRAWVNFNGTGTVAIRASFNVSSITDNGTGDYTVNFTNAMSDANYGNALTTSGWYGTSYYLMSTVGVDTSNNVLKTTSYIRVFIGNYGGSPVDTKDITVAIFR